MASKTREKQLAQQKAARRAARKAEKDRRRRRWLIAGGAVTLAAATGIALVMAAPWEDTSGEQSEEDAQAQAVNCTYSQPPVQGDATPARPVDVPPGEDVAATGTVPVTITTNSGAIGVDLDRAQAPCAVNSFLSLSEQGFYDNTPCHRLTTSPQLSVLQCGDPSGTGRGGPGYSFDTEQPDNLNAPYPRGVVAMANSGTPGSNGSQFFIVYADSQLPPDYTVFGTVTSGLEVVDGIAAAGTADGGTDGAPKETVTIVDVVPL